MLALLLAGTVTACGGIGGLRQWDAIYPEELVGSRVPPLWVISRGWYGKIHKQSPDLAEYLFKAEEAVLVVSGSHQKDDVEAYTFASFADFEKTLTTNPAQFEGVETVMYDPEGWKETPLEEQQHPSKYFALFGELAREHGFLVIITPHHSLVSAKGAECRVRPQESEVDAYLRCRIPRLAAQHADIVETQAQALEDEPSKYRTFVRRAGSQIDDANPDASHIVGLTSSDQSDPAKMREAWQSIRDLADGFYLAINGKEEIDETVAFLRLLPLPAFLRQVQVAESR